MICSDSIYASSDGFGNEGHVTREPAHLAHVGQRGEGLGLHVSASTDCSGKIVHRITQ